MLGTLLLLARCGTWPLLLARTADHCHAGCIWSRCVEEVSSSFSTAERPFHGLVVNLALVRHVWLGMGCYGTHNLGIGSAL